MHQTLQFQYSFVKLKRAVVSAVHNSHENKVFNRIFIKDPQTNLKFLIDSGSDVSVLPKTFRQNKYDKPEQSLIAANGSTVLRSMFMV